MPPPPDESTFANLLAETSRMRRLAAALLGGDADADVEDVLQEARVTALTHDLPRGRGLVPWLRRVVRHLSIDALRRRARRESRERSAASSEAQPGADELARRLELHRALVAAVAALPEPQRDAIVRRFFDGMKPGEIAAELGVPVATVKTRLQRGLATLREGLRRAWGGEFGVALVALSLRAGGAAVAGGASGAAGASAAGITVGAIAMSAKTKLVLAACVVAALIVSVPLALRSSRPSRSESREAGVASAAIVEGSRGVASRAAVEPMRAAETIPAATAAATVPTKSRRERLGEERVAGLSGRVVDEAGAPVAGAEVEILRNGSDELAVARAAGAPALASVRRTATADADGRFQFDELVRGTAFTVLARATDGRRGKFKRVCAGREDVVVPVYATGTVSGVVIDARDGQPIAGAVVQPWGGPRDAAVTTGTDGRFEIGGIELLFDNDGNGESFTAKAPDGRSSTLQFVAVRRGARATTTLRVGRADEQAPIEGSVVDAEDGAPIAGATIRGSVPGLGLDARTGSDGTFRLLPGQDWDRRDRVDVEVVAAGYAPCRVRLPPADDPQPRLVAKLDRGARATGRVVALDGTPLAGAMVVAREDGPGAKGRTVVAIADTDGCFELAGLAPLPPIAPDAPASADRRHVLLVRHDECELAALPFPREPVGRGSVDLGEFRFGPGVLVRGRVVDDTGAPIAHAVVGVIGLEDAGSRSLEDFFDVGSRIDCDGAGRFDLPGVPAGRWRLRASASGFVTHAETTVVVDGPDFAGEAKIICALGRTITGRVVDERGRPIAQATIWVRPPADEERAVHGPSRGFTTMMTGADGRFRAAGLPLGDWQLDVQPPAGADGRVFRKRSLDRVMPDTNGLEIVLEDGAAIAGRVRDGTGTVVAHVRVTAVDSLGEVVETSMTGMAGTFNLIVPLDAEVRLELRPLGSPFASRAAATGPPVQTIEHVFGGDDPLEITLPGALPSSPARTDSSHR